MEPYVTETGSVHFGDKSIKYWVKQLETRLPTFFTPDQVKMIIALCEQQKELCAQASDKEEILNAPLPLALRS